MKYDIARLRRILAITASAGVSRQKSLADEAKQSWLTVLGRAHPQNRVGEVRRSSMTSV